MSRQHSSYARNLSRLQRAAIDRRLERSYPKRRPILPAVLSVLVLIVTFTACVVNFPMPTR